MGKSSEKHSYWAKRWATYSAQGSAATKAHHDASIKYQDENDELATAIGIEAKNDGSYNSDFDTTEAQANKLRDQQLEMVENRHRRSQFYLETHVKALNSVDSMLSGVDLRSTQVTAEPPVDAFASREDHDTTLRDPTTARPGGTYATGRCRTPRKRRGAARRWWTRSAATTLTTWRTSGR